MDNQTVDTTLQACNFDIDLTIEKLQQLCLSSSNNPLPPPLPPQPPRQPPLSDKDVKWVDFFVEEMLCATDIEDARSRAARALAARDQDYHHQVVKTDNKQLNEKASTRLAQENIVLRRLVVLQHEKLKESEANYKKEVEKLNNMISKYREEIRVLELNNYSLRVHLNHPNSSFINASNLPPDVY